MNLSCHRDAPRLIVSWHNFRGLIRLETHRRPRKIELFSRP